MTDSHSPAEHLDAERALRDLVERMALVFDSDWDMTRTQLGVRADPWMIAPGGTFLNPRVDDESNNWANRGALLASYREAVEVLRGRGLALEDWVTETVRSPGRGSRPNLSADRRG